MTKLYQVYLDNKLLCCVHRTKDSAEKLASRYCGKGLITIIATKNV